jgi:hypothetical protein
MRQIFFEFIFSGLESFQSSLSIDPSRQAALLIRFSGAPRDRKQHLWKKSKAVPAWKLALAFCLHLEVAQVGISWNFLQENA